MDGESRVDLCPDIVFLRRPEADDAKPNLQCVLAVPGLPRLLCRSMDLSAPTPEMRDIIRKCGTKSAKCFVLWNEAAPDRIVPCLSASNPTSLGMDEFS